MRDPSNTQGYAAFRLRFRALLLDVGICFGVFLVGGMAAAVVLENSPPGRVAAFLTIVVFILAYEPIMVSRFGGTIGHRALNICVVEAKSGNNLPIWKATLRSMIKQFVGLISLGFMFVTKRAQGLHDLAVGSEVRVRNSRTAAAGDYFHPPNPADPMLPPAKRRVTIILLYNVFLLFLMAVIAGLYVSPDCLDRDVCSAADQQSLSFVSFGWLLMIAVILSLGWTGRLPGCRKRATRQI